MAPLRAPVGLHNDAGTVTSFQSDQATVQGYLSWISIANAGQKEPWQLRRPAPPGEDGDCPGDLSAAILAFQRCWVVQGELRLADGVVDAGGGTFRKRDALASAAPRGPDVDPDDIVVGDVTLR